MSGVSEGPAGRVVHVVAGPPEHGVTRHALDLLASPALAHHRVARATDARALDGLVASPTRDALEASGAGDALDGTRTPGASDVADAGDPPAPSGDTAPGPGDADLVHVHVTDRLFGSGAADAAERILRIAGPRPLSLTLHDLPQPHDVGPTGLARAAAYAELSRRARLVVVASEHERTLLARVGGDVSRVRVVPLPLAPRDLPAEGHARRASAAASAGEAAAGRAPGPRTVGVLGFLYPGKGHDTALAALTGLAADVELLALGRPSPGHEDLADDLTARAAAAGRVARVTGFVPDEELPARLRDVDVPAAPHAHVSASGSIGSWLSAGRRPLVADGAWVRELERRLPGALVIVEGDGPGPWREAVARALADPDSTWLPRDLRLAPTRDEAASAYAALLDAAARPTEAGR
ncbi:hypothetical protein [Agilicoccus flavus]|uniref:hypothetical protein n=1 Tax=Agilicoccus flavus TaxID=2775968 RepID=UPI001CF62AA7|nr:hypothetical protein [Agilicoccus flavus]